MDKCGKYVHTGNRSQLQGELMGNDNSSSNIIPIRRHGEEDTGHGERICNVNDVSDFMVGMLEALMRIATKKDQPMLNYFLDMAKMEAIDMKNVEKERPQKN